jgi:hypothetical protein
MVEGQPPTLGNLSGVFYFPPPGKNRQTIDIQV